MGKKSEMWMSIARASESLARQKRQQNTPTKMFRLLVIFVILFFLSVLTAKGEILSKSKLETCEKDFESQPNNLKCENKVVINMAVPSGSSGGEASLVAKLVEVQENDTQKLRIRDPPIITINKSAAYAVYELTYIRDVAYKPEELYVETHKFNEVLKGKRNTAHCVRFTGDWFHVFGIGKRSLGFSVTIEVKQGSSISRVVVGPENRTVQSSDNFLRVNLIGDFAGYTSIPSFENYYLVTPRPPQNANSGSPQELGSDFSKWMLLECVRFTLDGLECDKIGVSYEAFSTQPDFCSTPVGSCLHNQLFNLWEADHDRAVQKETPQYIVDGRFERINQHPDAGPHSFSIGITEVLNTNLLLELSADDIEYVYHMSTGKILNITIPTFEALKQSGMANVTVKNTGQLEASYSLTFDCTRGVSPMEEQFFILKPDEVAIRLFHLHSNTDQAANYKCSAILKASDFSEADRAECQFSTTTTVFDNGTQVVGTNENKSILKDFLQLVKTFFTNCWRSLVDFITGIACRRNCWIVLYVLMIAIFSIAMMLICLLLHQKGVFDPIYDWWRDRFGSDPQDQNYENHINRTRSRSHRHHHLYHQTTVHEPSSNALKLTKTDESHHHLLREDAEIELEEGDNHHLHKHKHHHHHQTAVHQSLSNAHKHRKNDESHQHLHRENAELGLEEVYYHRNHKHNHDHHHHHQTAVHKPLSHAHKHGKKHKSHHVHAEFEFEEAENHHHRHSRDENSLEVDKEGNKHKHSNSKRNKEKKLDPSLIEMTSKVSDEGHAHLEEP
ncbi:hypothetical protein LUZ60_011817 [Juncus effusus]|nr:hypothetical protein LUZ60_011817 [Juncus effusus]